MKSTLLSNLFALMLIVIQLLMGYLVITTNPDASALIIWQAVSGIVFLLIPSLLFIMITRQNFIIDCSIKKLSIKNILLLFALGLLIQPSMGLLAGLSSFIFPNDVSDFVQALSGLPLIYALFIVAVSPAICEEFAFRGVFASGYKYTDIKKAAFMNGLMFAALHLNGQQFLYAFVMGILFAYIVHITGSIFSSMLVHFIFNGTQLLLARFATSVNSDPAAAQAALGLSDTQLLIASISLYGFLTLITIPFLYIVIKALIDTNKKTQPIVLDSDCDNLSDSMILASTTQTYSDNYEITLKRPIQLSNEKILNWPILVIGAIYIAEVIIPLFR